MTVIGSSVENTLEFFNSISLVVNYLKYIFQKYNII